MPRGVCSEVGCPDEPVYRGRCQRHAQRTIQDRDKNRVAQRRIYNSAKWRRTRERILMERPLCEHEGCERIAEDVHHIRDIADGGDPWAFSNLQVLCHAHHARQTRADQLERLCHQILTGQ